MHFLREHSLSLSLLALTIFTTVGLALSGGEAKDFWNAFLGDSFGALIIVTFTKRLREKGSPESK
jgi:Zn-dependent protease with chaperone function